MLESTPPIKKKSNKGVKPGTKRGPYKKQSINLSNDQSVNETFEMLNNEIKNKQSQIDVLQSRIADSKQTSVYINELKSEIERLKNSQPEPIKAPCFIYDPSPVFTAMNRVIAYQIKEGKLKKDSLILQNFTTAAIKYYIQNEFNHILK